MLPFCFWFCVIIAQICSIAFGTGACLNNESDVRALFAKHVPHLWVFNPADVDEFVVSKGHKHTRYPDISGIFQRSRVELSDRNTPGWKFEKAWLRVRDGSADELFTLCLLTEIAAKEGPQLVRWGLGKTWESTMRLFEKCAPNELPDWLSCPCHSFSILDAMLKQEKELKRSASKDKAMKVRDKECDAMKDRAELFEKQVANLSRAELISEEENKRSELHQRLQSEQMSRAWFSHQERLNASERQLQSIKMKNQEDQALFARIDRNKTVTIDNMRMNQSRMKELLNRTQFEHEQSKQNLEWLWFGAIGGGVGIAIIIGCSFCMLCLFKKHRKKSRREIVISRPIVEAPEPSEDNLDEGVKACITTEAEAFKVQPLEDWKSIKMTKQCSDDESANSSGDLFEGWAENDTTATKDCAVETGSVI